MPALLARAPMRRVTVLALVVALVLSMLTLFTVPAALAQEIPPGTLPGPVAAEPEHAPAAEPTAERGGTTAAAEETVETREAPEAEDPVLEAQEPTPLVAPEAPASSPSERARVAGQITLPAEAAGNEAEWFATLTVVVDAGDRGHHEGSVDAAGRFELPDVIVGEYWVSVESENRAGVSLPGRVYWDGGAGTVGSQPVLAGSAEAEALEISLPVAHALSGELKLPEEADPEWFSSVSVIASRVVSSDTGRIAVAEARASVEANGTFLIERLTPSADYVLRVVEERNHFQPSYYPGVVDLADAELIDIGAPAAALTPMLLDWSRSVTGVLLPPDGEASGWTEYVTISLIDVEDASFEQTTRPQPDGSFVFSELPVGSYRVHVEGESGPVNILPRFYPGAEPEAADAGTVDVGEVPTVTLDPLQLLPGAVLEGRIQLPEGAPSEWLGGVSVDARLDDWSNTGREYGGRVDPATGDFRVTGLESGEYALAARANTEYREDGTSFTPNLLGAYFGGARQFAEAERMTLETAEVRAGLDVALALGVSVSGTISIPEDAPVEWLAGIDVRSQNWARTDFLPPPAEVDGATGAYELVGLDAGEHAIEVLVGGYFPEGDEWEERPWVQPDLVPRFYSPSSRGLNASAAEILELGEGQATSGIDVTLERGYAIAGTVTLGSGVPASWITGVHVESELREDETLYTVNTMVEADGTFRLTQIPAGSHTVKFSDVTFTSEEGVEITPNLTDQFFSSAITPDQATPVEVVAADVSGVDAELQLGRTVRGKVVLPEGVGPEAFTGMTVSASNERQAPEGESTVGPDGSYRITGLAEDAYFLHAFPLPCGVDDEPCSYHPVTMQVSHEVDLRTTHHAEQDLQLDAARRVSGIVSLPEGADPSWLESVMVSIIQDGDGPRYRNSLQVDSGTGTYEFRYVPEGD